MQDYVGVHYLPCFAMCCTIVHNTLIVYGAFALCIGIIYAQCMSNPQSIGNDEIFRVSVSWCVTCVRCLLSLTFAVDFL